MDIDTDNFDVTIQKHTETVQPTAKFLKPQAKEVIDGVLITPKQSVQKPEINQVSPTSLMDSQISDPNENNGLENSVEQNQEPNQINQQTESNDVVNKWFDEFNKLKETNDKEGIQNLYDKLRVALNGITDNERLKELKSEIENYAKGETSTNEESQTQHPLDTIS